MITIDSTTIDNHMSTLGTGTNYWENDTGAHKNLSSDQVERAFGLFRNSIDTGNITANVNGSNCYHESWFEDEYFLIVTISPVLRMNYFLIVTLKRVLMMTLFLIVTLLWMRMNLSD